MISVFRGLLKLAWLACLFVCFDVVSVALCFELLI